MSELPRIDEATLPDGLQRGLAAIREGHIPDAAAVVIDGNFVYVSLGSMTKASVRAGDAPVTDAILPEGYAQDQALLFARVSRNFPNAESYGVVTVPFLTRTDAAGIPWQHQNHGSAQPLAAALGRSHLGFWSWSWQGVPARREEDLAAVVEWARKCVREGAA